MTAPSLRGAKRRSNLPFARASAAITSPSHCLIVNFLFADLDDVLGKDHLLAADPRRDAGRGQIAREHPYPVGRVRDDLGEAAIGECDLCARRDLSDVDWLAHSAASARADWRQLTNSSQLSASMNWAQRRYRL